MYDELVKRLRNRANGSYEEKCEGCEFTEGFPPCVHCTIKAFNDAADAIEELQKLTDAQLGIIKQYQAHLTKQRWIPVTEPPKEGKPVFVHIPCRYRKQESIPMIAFWEQGQWKEYESHRSVYNITHWQPLPEPLAEEGE